MGQRHDVIFLSYLFRNKCTIQFIQFLQKTFMIEKNESFEKKPLLSSLMFYYYFLEVKNIIKKLHINI